MPVKWVGTQGRWDGILLLNIYSKQHEYASLALSVLHWPWGEMKAACNIHVLLMPEQNFIIGIVGIRVGS